MKLFSVSPFRSSLTVGLVIRKDGKRTTTWNVSWVDSVLARESSVLGGLRLGHSPLLFWLAEYGPSACFLRILLKLYYMEKVSLDRYRIGSSRNRFVRIVNISWRLEDDELTPTAPTYLYQFRIYISLVGRAINFFSVRLRTLPCGFRRLIPRKPEAVSSTLHISGFLKARSSKLEAIMLILVVCFNYGTFLQWNSYCWQAHHRKWTGTGNVLKSRCGLCFSPAMNWSIVTAELPFGKLLEWAYDNWSDCLAQTHRLSEIGSISVGLVQDGLLGSSWNIVCSQAFGVLRSMNWSDS